MRMTWQSSALQGLGVLAGILTAFAIDAAWEDRGDRHREVAYLQALSAELATNGSRFRAYRERAEAAIAADEGALRTIVFTDEPVTPAVLSEVIAGFGALFLTLPERAALSDILASGGVAYIEDPEVRRLISKYSDALDQQIEWTASASR